MSNRVTQKGKETVVPSGAQSSGQNIPDIEVTLSGGSTSNISGNLSVDSSNAPPDFVRDVEAAIAYAEAIGDTTFSDLANQNNRQTIIRYTDGPSHHGVGNASGNSYLMWNPREGISFNGGTQSPALGLLHEAGHSSDYAIMGITNVTNQHELGIINGIEANAARFYGEGVRTSHTIKGRFTARCALCDFR